MKFSRVSSLFIMFYASKRIILSHILLINKLYSLIIWTIYFLK